MGFAEAVKTVLGKYATFSGRATRPEYWWWYLFMTIVALVISVPFSFIVATSIDADAGTVSGGFWLAMILPSLIALAFFLPNLAVTIRRLHDTGRSGWWVLLAFIPFVNFIGGLVVLIFMLLPTQPQDNEYGPVAPGYGSLPTAPPAGPPAAPPVA